LLVLYWKGAEVRLSFWRNEPRLASSLSDVEFLVLPLLSLKGVDVRLSLERNEARLSSLSEPLFESLVGWVVVPTLLVLYWKGAEVRLSFWRNDPRLASSLSDVEFLVLPLLSLKGVEVRLSLERNDAKLSSLSEPLFESFVGWVVVPTVLVLNLKGVEVRLSFWRNEPRLTSSWLDGELFFLVSLLSSLEGVDVKLLLSSNEPRPSSLLESLVGWVVVVPTLVLLLTLKGVGMTVSLLGSEPVLLSTVSDEEFFMALSAWKGVEVT